MDPTNVASPQWLVALNLVARTFAVGLILAIVARGVQEVRRNGAPLRAFLWVFAGFGLIIGVAWVATLEEILDILPGVNLRKWVNDWISLFYLPLLVALWRFWRIVLRRR